MKCAIDSVRLQWYSSTIAREWMTVIMVLSLEGNQRCGFEYCKRAVRLRDKVTVKNMELRYFRIYQS